MKNSNYQALGSAIFDVSNPVTEDGKDFINEFGNKKNHINGPLWDDFVIAAQALESGDLNYIMVCLERSTGLIVSFSNNPEGYFRVKWASIVLFDAPLVGYKTWKLRTAEKLLDLVKKLKNSLTKLYTWIRL